MNKPSLLITYPQLIQLVNYGKTSPHKEVCGALMGQIIDKEKHLYKFVNFVPITNVANDELADYIFDQNQFLSKVLMKSNLHLDHTAPLSFIGTFHNHPYWRPIPSQTDIDNAGYAGIYIIYSNIDDDLMAWYNEGSDDPDISYAMYNNSKGFGGAYLLIR